MHGDMNETVEEATNIELWGQSQVIASDIWQKVQWL